VTPLRVLIVDDESVARRRIRRLLAAEPDVSIVGECADGASALSAIAKNRPDVAFLDVQMPGLDGFGVVRSLTPAELPAIVFVTAHDRYALRAFDVQAIDYLLKPFTRERFRTALARARERLHGRAERDRVERLIDHLSASKHYPSRVAVRTGDRFVVVEWRDVDWIEAADNYVTLHAGAREYLIRDTLASIERQLDPDRFTRIHRSTIVQIDRIVELHPATHGDFDVVLRNGSRLTLTRTWRDGVQRRLRIGSPSKETPLY
jgi:two-component system, LytTR family, response regulator